jgi:hypothetical protein
MVASGDMAAAAVPGCLSFARAGRTSPTRMNSDIAMRRAV